MTVDKSEKDDNERLLALIRWAYELTESALFLKGHAARKAMVKACSEINHRFKEIAS